MPAGPASQICEKLSHVPFAAIVCSGHNPVYFAQIAECAGAFSFQRAEPAVHFAYALCNVQPQLVHEVLAFVLELLGNIY